MGLGRKRFVTHRTDGRATTKKLGEKEETSGWEGGGVKPIALLLRNETWGAQNWMSAR